MRKYACSVGRGLLADLPSHLVAGVIIKDGGALDSAGSGVVAWSREGAERSRLGEGQQAVAQVRPCTGGL